MSLKGDRILTQNEPEGGERMLGIDHQHAGWRKLSLGRSERFWKQAKKLSSTENGGRRCMVNHANLQQQRYGEQGKKVRGVLRRFVAKMTGRSRAQTTRLVGRYLKHSEVKESSARRRRFASRFTRADIELLAKVDEAHETLSSPATKRILVRECEQYKHAAYERLATISVAHIYNLRRRRHYRECWLSYTPHGQCR